MNEVSSGEIHASMRRFWIENNIGFLYRFWHTSRQALAKVEADPETFDEFRVADLDRPFVSAILKTHLAHHNYGVVLLTYSLLDELLLQLSNQLARVVDAPIKASELRDRGVRRYRKFVHQVCRVPAKDREIPWEFLEDFTVVRHAIIHASGNRSLLVSPQELNKVVSRHSDALDFQHSAKLVVKDGFVEQCILATRASAVALVGAIEERERQRPFESA